MQPRATDRIHPDPKEEFSLNVLNNSPGEEAISSIMTKLAKDIQLKMGKMKWLYGLVTYGLADP